jgi:hypothetical protein
MIPGVKPFTVTFSLVTKDEIMKLSAIEQSNQLTKQTRMPYHLSASLFLAIGFVSQLNHALQGGNFSMF